MKYRVKNWSSLQSYKDRKPPWIRLHKTILDNFEFQMMSAEARAMLPMLWLLASEDDNPQSGIIKYNISQIAFRLRLDEKIVTDSIREIKEAGFFEDVEVCNETVPDALQNRNETVPPETEAYSEAYSETEEIWAFSQTLDIPQPKIKKSIIEIQGIIKARLKDGYTAEELIWHLQRYMEKKKAHGLYLERHGKDPEPGTPAWCPMVTWGIREILSPKRLEKYFEIWKAEKDFTAESLLARMNKGKTGDVGKWGDKVPDRELTEEEVEENRKRAEEVLKRYNRL